ncbi:bile acid:sodium symporter [Massilia solisilvae]|uniref:Bile acid:sodium symporter n=1 Tax=Massilia solisilvae TaxID=1811225 RepID=A0ABT2BGC8_9BURK|nr:bile acid:sodium symporter family protein [Massilia solisilvae]MCS0607490.1 bile acid:sodium symporter [Massilia solisilvae]
MMRRLALDPFTVLLMVVVALASLFPASGQVAVAFGHITTLAIGMLFFLHGAKLSREALVSGLTHWRLHLLVLASTFVLFPLLGLAIKPLALALLTPDLYLGVLFLCALPSTVQSSIAFTALARGNVAAAVCSASASNFLGIFITPLLVSVLIARGAAGGSPLDSVLTIVEQLLLPFIAGQLLRPLIGAWVDRHKPVLKFFDQGSILLVVYTAFSDSVNEGLWQKVSLSTLIGILVISALILAVMLGAATLASRRLGFSKEDEITIVFCGSKKSLASGVPMAKVLFAPSALGMIILPLMLFHQLQLMVCAVLAGRLARRPDSQTP